MKLTPQEIQKFRDVPIHTILGVSNNGRDVKLCCMIHNEKTPSFVLHPNNSYHCFGCNIHGNGAIDFCQHLGLSWSESLEELCRYISLDIR